MVTRSLLVCSSTPANVRRAIERFPMTPSFSITTWILLCTAGEFPELEKSTQGPTASGLSEASRKLRLRRGFGLKSFQERLCRGRRTLVPGAGRMLAKVFALLCLGRRLLVFN